MRSFYIYILFLLAVMGNKSCSTSFGDTLTKLVTSDIVNADYVPAPRNLLSTKWNYFYSFAILTQKPATAAYIADNLLRACLSNNLDCYVVARKVWRETHSQIIQISYLPEWTKHEDGTFTVSTNRCAYGILQVNLKRHKHRLDSYKDGALKPVLNCYEDYEREILKLEVNVDVGTSIFRDYLNLFNGRVDYALCSYFAGENSAELRSLKSGKGNDYVTWIMDERLALSEMTMYKYVNYEMGTTNSWRYVAQMSEKDFLPML